MSENILLFTGEERFTLQQELIKWKTAFCEKYGSQNLFVFHSDELDGDRIQQALLWWGMFATKTMIVLYGILKEGDSDPVEIDKKNKGKTAPKPNSPEQIGSMIEQYWTHISADTFVIVVSYKPDRRTKGFKFFAQNAKVKEFKPLAGVALKAYVRQIGAGLLTTEASIDALLDTVGTNVALLHNEIEKLRCLAEWRWLKSISPDLIKQVCFRQAETNSFALLDSFLTNRKQALITVQQLQNEQQFPMIFLGMLYRGIKLMLQMADLHDQGMTASKDLASALKMHPFAVSKQLKQLPTIKANRKLLAHLFHDLLTINTDITTGKLEMEFFWVAIKRTLHLLQ